jgi:type II secretory pathway component PulK
VRLANQKTLTRARPRRGGQRGIALLMAVVVTAVLGALSVQFTYNLSANVYMAGNLLASTQAYYNARSATRIALLAVNAKQNFPQMQQFLSLMGKSGVAPGDWQRACDFVNIFATGKAEFFGTSLLDFSHEKAIGSKSLKEGVAAFTCKVSAEDARVNLNRAATEIDPNLTGDPAVIAQNMLAQQQRKAAQLYVQLGGLLQPMAKEGGVFENEDEIIDVILAIIDWTDADNSRATSIPRATRGRRWGGATTASTAEAKNAKMDTVGEVQLVEGMSSEAFCQIRDKLTVFATDKINVNDADRRC